MLLNELFKTATTKVSWSGKDHASFKVDDVSYDLFFAPVRSGDMWHGPIKGKPELEPDKGSSYFVGFLGSTSNQLLTDLDLGGKNAIKVFSIVLQQVQKWAKKEKPTMIYFGCHGNNPKRLSLYQRLVDRFTGAETDWKVIGEADGDYQGPKHLWVLKKS